MNVSISWLKELIQFKEPIDQLAREIGLKSTEVASVKPLVQASHLVVGYVEKKESHPDASKLSVCQVNIGKETIQIICGAPNVAQGQKVIVALNGAVLPGDFQIKKAVIRGIESNGMICSLDELGIEKKYHEEEGIHVLPADSPIGANPLEILHYLDTVLELELTPNKGYLLSMLGVAYDVAAITKSEVIEPVITLHESNIPLHLNVSTTSPDCISYYARVVDGVQIKESPYWLKARLIANQIRPINNVVDITNYVMLEYGQPLHAFDASKLATDSIVVRKAQPHETIQTLDGCKRILTTDDLVITDGQVPVALAGVMGGFSTQIDASSTSILLESAVFHPITIRKTSKRLDLRSESSMRFERGLDPARTIQALNRACMLLQSLANGSLRQGVASFDHSIQTPKQLVVSLQTINKVLGTSLSSSEVSSLLKRYGFAHSIIQQTFEVWIPSRRRDVETYQDLIEEIVRMYGFDQIPTTLPIGNYYGKLSPTQKLRRDIQTTLSDLGLDEVITYSLVSKEKAVWFDEESKPVVELMHPMSEERSSLRHSLLPSLLEALTYNVSRKNEDVFLYELGRTYYPNQEIECISGVLSGKYSPLLWQGKRDVVDFFLVKGLLESLFDAIGFKQYSIQKPSTPIPNLHPGISASIVSNDSFIGFVGRLHPQVERMQGIGPTFVFELNFDLLATMVQPIQKMKEVSKYPKVTRDIALVVDEEVTAGELMDKIRQVAKSKLVDVTIFDIFRGPSVGEGKKSVALSLQLQDQAKTLETQEVDQLIQKILGSLKHYFNAVLRS
jgi:phenylalanyl-tRNA synthetase beta chain